MKLVSRAAWGARSRSTSTNITPGNGGVSIHYVGASHINDSHGSCAGRVRGIQNHHINGNGWADIAYSLLVCAHGYVYVGRGLHRRTAANGTNSGNQNWYAVCALIGGSQQPTAAMVQGIRDAVAYLRSSGGAASQVNGHRDHLPTSCPGNPLYAMVRDGTFGSGGSGNPDGGGGGLLRRGDRGSAVTALQRDLMSLGYPLPQFGADGDFGSETEQAVRAFQRDAGIGVDGIAGPQTFAAIAAALEGDDVPDRNMYTTTSGYTQPVPAGEWTTVRFDRRWEDGDGWETKTPEPSFIFGPAYYVASAGVRVSGLERGQEFQMRFAYYRETESGSGRYERYASMPIDSPTHDAGSGHFTSTWSSHVSGSRRGRVRLEVIHYGSADQDVQITSARADALYWKG